MGPVTFDELQALARNGGLNPRLDMVWTQDMEDWKPAGEIDGLFERRSQAVPLESLADSVDPCATGQEESVAEKMSREREWPGSPRPGFLAATILFPAAWYFAFPMSKDFLTEQLGPHIMDVVDICAAFLPLVVGMLFGLKRLVNLGMSRWWYLVNLPVAIIIGWFVFRFSQEPTFLALEASLLVSLFGVSVIPLPWLGYRCFACPPGYAFHRKIGGAGVALAILFWLITLAIFAAIAVAAAVLLDMIDSPEIQDWLKEILRYLPDQMK